MVADILAEGLEAMTDPHVAAERERTIEAALNMDWTQVALNHPNGPPCFHLFDDGFCGRAKRWVGHGDPNHHNYVSLADALQAAFEAGRSEGEQIVVTQIEQSTGPTGGWLDSPKAICAAIVQALKGKP